MLLNREVEILLDEDHCKWGGTNGEGINESEPEASAKFVFAHASGSENLR